MRIVVGFATICTLAALVLCIYASKLWWEVPTLVVVSALTHWENFSSDTPLPIQRSLSLRRFGFTAMRELFRIVWILLIFILVAGVRYEMSTKRFLSAVSETSRSPTERAFYIHVRLMHSSS